MSAEARATLIVEAKTDGAEAALGKLGGKAEQTGKDAKGMGEGFGGAVQSLTGFNVASLAGVGAITAVIGVMKGSIDKTMQWADEIDRLSRATGESAAETSLMVTAFGAAGINVSTLESSFKTLTKNGLQPNMETFKRLAAEYQAIEDPVKRNEFAMKNLGRSAKEMTEILSKTPEQLDSLAAAAANSGKVIDEAMTAKTEELAIKSQQLQDKLDGLQIMMGGPLVDAGNAVVDGFNNEIKALSGYAVVAQMSLGIIDRQQAALKLEAIQAGNLTAAYTELEDPLDRVLDAHERGAEETQHLADQEAALEIQTLALASTWQNYASTVSDGAQASYDAAMAARQLELDQRKLADTQIALAAGLSGEIGQAYKDYQAVMADTQPTIAELLAENEKLMAAQGVTVTTVNEATNSQAEYDLALQGVAAAQVKLSENTDPEKQLALTVAFEKAQEKAEKMATGLGSTTSATIDNSTAIADNTAKIAELNARQAEAEAQAMETAKAFIFEKISAGLTAEETLSLARGMGILDEASFTAAESALELRHKYDDGKISLEGMTTAANDLATGLANAAKDYKANFTVTTNYVENGAPRDVRDDNGNVRMQASGGQAAAGQPYIVGDGGRPELFVPNQAGYIYPSVPSGDNTSSTGDMMAALSSLQFAMSDIPRAIRDAIQTAW